MEKEKCINFFKLNGWEITDEDDEFIHLHNFDNFSVDIDNENIFLIDDRGVFKTLPLDYYYLIGYFYVHRLINIFYV
jgi:hypothetical protein